MSDYEKEKNFLLQKEAEVFKNVGRVVKDMALVLLPLSLIGIIVGGVLAWVHLGTLYGLFILIGGFFGAIKGVIVLFGVAAVIRLYVVLGSDKMLFFNHKAIDRSHIFRYIYAFITDKF